jgi:Tol biopolymer transport system component/DNA-binding CsgD family transcriptional regulator
MATRGRPPHPDILTPREWEVFELVREGLNNRQIAKRLDITRAAVKYHVSEILGKLAAVSREEASAWDPRQRPDWTPRWDPTRRPAWATALAPLGLFWRRLTGGLAHSAGALGTLTSVALGVALVAGVTTLAVLVMRTRGSSNDASVVVQSTSAGKIAFMTDREGNREIYVMNADGSGQTNLTHGPGGEDNFGAWSPDGSRIAFTSNRDGNNEVYVVNADGSGLTKLTKNPGTDGFGAWSPDGSRIAFNSNRNGNLDIYVMNADGSGQTRLTNNPALDIFRAWSRDGSRIGFIRCSPENGCEDGTYYVMAADGSGLTNLTNIPGDDGMRVLVNSLRAVESAVAWSPDGSRIAFISNRDGNSEIYVMAADGSGQTRLTNNPGDDRGLAWSPDGSRLAFTSNRDGTQMEIYVVAADGSNVTRLANFTNTSVADCPPDNVCPDADVFVLAWSPDGSRIAFNLIHTDVAYKIHVMNADGFGLTSLSDPTKEQPVEVSPAWSPDSSRIAFLTGRDGNREIYVMNADGSGPTNLTNNPGEDYDPVWSPAQ